MKIGVCIYLQEIDKCFNHTIEWNHSLLPRIGEKVIHPIMFFSEEMKQELKLIKASDVLKNPFDDFGIRRTSIENDSLLEYYEDYPDDPFIIETIEWRIDQSNNPYPELGISIS